MNVGPRYCFALGLLLAFLSKTVSADDLDPLAGLPDSVGGKSVALPQPSMADGLNPDEQAAVLKQVAGKYSLDRFMKDSIVAPFHLDRQTVKDASGKRVGHQVDLWFVAHGPMSAIGDESLFRDLIGEDDESGSGESLPETKLAEHGLSVVSKDAGDTKSEIAYFRFAVPVLDRVKVEGVVRARSRSTPHSHLASVMIEPAFDSDKEYPNRWRSLKDDSATNPYRGYGGYAKATKLSGYDDAILIECHAVVHEPEGWFDGANLLGSKLPIAIQNSVRSFRRTLGKRR